MSLLNCLLLSDPRRELLTRVQGEVTWNFQWLVGAKIVNLRINDFQHWLFYYWFIFLFYYRKIFWRYSYVVTSNGHALDVSRHYGVSSTTLTSNLNFTSASKENYFAVNTEVGSYKEMFSLQVENIQSTFKTQKILEELLKIWTGNVHIAGDLLREEYLSVEG